MSIWDNFVENILGISPAGQKELVESVKTQISAPVKAAKAFPGFVLNQTVLKPISSGLQGAAVKAGYSPEDAALAGIEIEKSKIGQYASKESEKFTAAGIQVIDPVLELGQEAEKYVFSPLIARPISTAFLLTDPKSKLYKSDELGLGFQFSDIRDAYNRSADVSLGQSFLKTEIPFLSGFAGIERASLEKYSNIDMDKVDLWNDEDIQANFRDNILGKYITGFNDTIIKNVAISGAFSITAAASKTALVKSGLTTNFKITDVNALPKWEKTIDDHIQYRQTNGQTGKLSVIGSDIENMAFSTNSIEIKNILFGSNGNRHSLNPRLPNLILETKDPLMVRDYILADKGYAPAIERLSQARRSHDMWYAADGNLEIQSYFIQNNKMPTPTPDQRARWMQAYDDAIAAEPKHKEIFDAFLKASYSEGPLLPGASRTVEVSPKFWGLNYKPAEPVIGKTAYAALRSRKNALKAAAVQRDWSNVGGSTQAVLGGRANGPVTVAFRLFGTMMPKGFVTHSGLRPMNGIDEIIATFDDIPLFANGNKIIKTETLQDMTVSEYRLSIIDKFISATDDTARAAVVKDLNLNITKTIAYTRGYFNDSQINNFVEINMENVYAVHGDLTKYGHAMDPSGVRLTTNPESMRQLQNSSPLLPFGELDKLIARAARKEKNIAVGIAQKPINFATDATQAVFEMGNKAFSFAQLYRFSYIPKNSIFEPILSAFIAQGSQFGKALLTSLATARIENSVNFVIRNIEKSKTILPNAKKEIQRELKALSKQYDQAVINRDIVYAEYEKFFSDIPGVSPKTKLDWADDVRSDLRKAELQVEQIEKSLNKYTVEYGKPIEVPSVYNLRKRIETLKSVGKTEKIKLFPGLQDYGDGGSGGLIGTRSTVGFVKVSVLKDMPGNKLSNTEGIAALRKSIREGKGFATRDYEGKPYQDPIMIVYDNETGLAYIGEGNHRLQAAIDEGIPYVPVRVVRGNKEEMISSISSGRKPKQIKNGKEPQFVETIGPNIGKVRDPKYVPPEMHPSLVFDKKFIVEKDEFSQSNGSVQFASDIARAELVLQKAVGNINTLAPELKIVEAEIVKAYDAIGKALNDISPKLKESSSLFSVTEKRNIKKPSMPDMVRRELSNGQVVEFPSFTNENYLGSGYFSEIANHADRTIELLGNKATVAKIKVMGRNSPKGITNVADPGYFDELQYVINNHMRGDELIDQIFLGVVREELLKWAHSPVGASYVRLRGLPSDRTVEVVDDAMSYVNRYLPDAEAQRLASIGPVKVTDLQRTLADKLNQMVPIQPLEVPYGNPTIGYKSIAMGVDAALAGAWKTLAKPENIIREVWGNVEHANRVTSKVEMLLAQGYEINWNQLMAIRQSTAAEIVKDVNKVFYSIPRQSRALYFARAITTFPNAAASGIYRYGRFVFKQPRRTAIFVNNYHSLYNSFGVDKYGNPVENPTDADYLIIPGTKEMGFNNGKGIIVSSRATNFIANLPGAAFLVPVALSQVFSWKPDSDDELKKIVNSSIGKIPGYSWEELFPFGVEPSLKAQLGKTFTPAWGRNLLIAFNQSKTNELWVDSLISESNRQQILFEMGVGPQPTEKTIINGTKSIYLRKFRTQFFSILGTPQYVESMPDSIYKDYYYLLVDKYKAKGLTDREASNAAENEFQKQMYSTESKIPFPIDRLFVDSKDKIYTGPPSQKSYDRIWKDFAGLATQLEAIDPDLVGLLTSDLPKDYNNQINKFLNDPNSTLPGGTKLNSQLKTIKMVEDELTKSRFWKDYTEYKEVLNKAAIEAGEKSYRSIPELVSDLKNYAKSLGAASEPWKAEYSGSKGTKDVAWLQAYGLQKIINNKDFMNKYGKTQFWTHAKLFVEYRNEYVKAYADTPTGYKTIRKTEWA